jgi:outer membrane protein TolC
MSPIRCAHCRRMHAQSITDKQLLHRQVTYFVLLNAEHTYLQSSLAHVQAQANRYADTAALFQALSGGWWNRLYIPTR